MLVELKYDSSKLTSDLRLTKTQVIRATLRAFDRMGLFVEARAVSHAKVSSGRLRGSIHSEGAEHNRATDSISVVVSADAGYALFVEMGFAGHFVPFNVSESLYYQALRQWGWKLPDPGDIPAGHPNRKYLVPRGRKRPVWGVFVSGKARPFLRPAVDELMDTQTYHGILREEFAKALGV